MAQSGGDRLCTCLAVWMAELLLAGNKCPGCETTLSDNKSHRSCLLVIPCAHTQFSKQVHIYQVAFHNSVCPIPGLEHTTRCGVRFMATAHNLKRGHVFDMIEDKELDKLNDAEIERYCDLALVRHQFTGTGCAHCGTPEQKDALQNVCSRCSKVRYCNKACQTQDWPKHKEKCRLPRVATGLMNSP